MLAAATEAAPTTTAFNACHLVYFFCKKILKSVEGSTVDHPASPK
jgi:hypothetical protein